MESGASSRKGQALIALLVGALIGFAAGYFAGGGGRPSEGTAARASGPSAGGAVGEAEAALARDPENPELLKRVGNLHYDREEWDAAIAAYEKARRKAPKDPDLLSDLGASYRNRGELKLAVSYFRKAREAKPDHWQSLVNEVLVEAFDRKDPAAAQRAYDELKRRHPEIPQIDRIQDQISKIRAGA
ncbi:MAG TPA: tetratricopeptide repeat protein [Thermoanaerobaculia bacterium]|nr:tetratricopeptide repeat protein [Thermoanaerobaculia bacterium]